MRSLAEEAPPGHLPPAAPDPPCLPGIHLPENVAILPVSMFHACYIDTKIATSGRNKGGLKGFP